MRKTFEGIFFLITDLLSFHSATTGRGLITGPSMVTQMRYKQDFLYHLPLWEFSMQIFANSIFYRVIFATSLRSSFDRRHITEGKNNRSVNMICEAVEGSRRNMAHYSLMHMKIKSICQSIFSVNVFYLYCIIFLNNGDFYFTSALFFCSLTFFWPHIQTILKLSTFLFLLSCWEKGWKLRSFSSHIAFIAFKFYTDQTEVV